MMKRKDECEAAIRHLCGKWAEATGQDTQAPGFHPSFLAFRSWVEEQGYGSYLRFRSVRGAAADAELWFDEEFKQTWRN